MKHGLLLGLDGAGKTLLLRQLALQLLKCRKSVVDRIVALAQSSSCVRSVSDMVASRSSSAPLGSHATATGNASANPTGVNGDVPIPTPATDVAALASSASAVLQNALNYATSHPTLALVYGNSAPKEEKALDHDTRPTIGVEHTSLSIDGKTFSICEVGGQLLPMWKAYFDANDFWIYVVDISSTDQLAGAAIEFFNIMRVESMRKKPKLLLLNKMDVCFTIDDATIRAYLCLDRLMTDAFSPSSSSGPMHVLKVSASSGENTDAVLKWIAQRWHNSTGSIGGPSPAHVAAGTGSSTTLGLSGRKISFNKTGKQRVHPVVH